jgi:RNA polymerase sigma-70 factor (ECF subfamily)
VTPAPEGDRSDDGAAAGRPAAARRADGEPAEPDDAALLRAHVDGDPQAFTTLVRRHRDRLWAVALRTLGDPEEAADALQDALISALRNAGSYRAEAAVTTWLHRVVVNACLDRVRRRKVRAADPLGERDLPSPRDEHAATVTRLDVRAALARLPEAQRLALVLVDMEDLSVAEAAEVLGVPEGTVKSRCARGRAALAVLLRPSAARAGDTAPDPHRDTGPAEGNRTAPRRVAPPGEGPQSAEPSAAGGGQ